MSAENLPAYDEVCGCCEITLPTVRDKSFFLSNEWAPQTETSADQTQPQKKVQIGTKTCTERNNTAQYLIACAPHPLTRPKKLHSQSE